jgi:hypothetical protein
MKWHCDNFLPPYTRFQTHSQQMRQNRRAKAENVMYQYKAIIGNKLKSRAFVNQKTESKVAINILNIMTKLSRPSAKKIA